MGAGSAGILERGNAGRLIGIDAGFRPGVHVSDPERAVGRRIEIGVEHTGLAAELQLQARTLAHLKSGAPEMAHKIRCGQTDELARGRSRHRSWLGDLRLSLRAAGKTGGEEQGKDKD